MEQLHLINVTDVTEEVSKKVNVMVLVTKKIVTVSAVVIPVLMYVVSVTVLVLLLHSVHVLKSMIVIMYAVVLKS